MTDRYSHGKQAINFTDARKKLEASVNVKKKQEIAEKEDGTKEEKHGVQTLDFTPLSRHC
jgi:hypothetical protein